MSRFTLFASLVALLYFVCLPAVNSQITASLGFQWDPKSASAASASNEAANDLHCNPIQQFNTIPSSGATFNTFNTYWNPAGSSVSGVCRMALYSITGGVWSLVVGTNTQSDIQLVPSSTPGPVEVKSSGPFTYGSGTSATLYPNQDYSICFTNNGGNLTGNLIMYEWPDSQPNFVVVPYYLSQPLPTTLVATGTSSSTWQLWLTATGAFNTQYSQILGYMTDPSATGNVYSAGEAALDLHCNPPQQYTTLPSAGGTFTSFSATYNSAATTIKGVIRMALYQVTGSTYSLVVGTSSASDIQVGPGATSGPSVVSTAAGAAFTYANGASSATILPTNTYAVCFTNDGGELGGSIVQYLWADSKVSQLYEPYSIYSPLPTSFAANASQTSQTTWQVWFNVSAVGAGYVPPVPTPVYTSTGPSDLTAGCYGNGPQQIMTFTYQYTAGCTTGTASAFPWGCSAGNVNGTGGGYYYVNLTFVMLTSTIPVVGTIGQPNAAYQVCSLLPGSQRTVATALSGNGFVPQFTTTPIHLSPIDFDTKNFIYNNWYYPNAAAGLQFDSYGIVYEPQTSWQGISFLNLCAGNPYLPLVGAQGQLMEESYNGALGIINEPNIAMSAQSTPTLFKDCSSYPASWQRKNWTFIYTATSKCVTGSAFPTCTNIASSPSGTAGYYTVNVTMFIQTLAQPLTDRGGNSSFLICSLLPGSQRAVTWSVDGTNTQSATSAITLAGLSDDTTEFNYNNWFLPFSAGNGANGANDGVLGLNYFFDQYGIVYKLATPWNNLTYINLCTSNPVSSSYNGGVQLAEESRNGAMGIVTSGFSVTLSPDVTTNGTTSCPPLVGSAIVNQFTFNLLQQSVCTPGNAFTGCTPGTPDNKLNGGYYTLNLTFNMITPVAGTSTQTGVQTGYRTCSLAAGSQRSTSTSLTGGPPVQETSPIWIVPYDQSKSYGSADGFNYDNVFYPLSSINGANGATTGSFGLDYYFDNYGMLYTTGSPWLGTYPYINLCTSNAVLAGSANTQLAEEGYNSQLGQVVAQRITVTQNTFVQQQSWYFCYSASAVPNGNGAASYATTISGVMTGLSTSDPTAFQLIYMSATRTSTNYNGQQVSTPVQLVGGANNMLYVGSTSFPNGLDASGWALLTQGQPYFGAAASTINMNSTIYLAPGIESANGLTTSYGNPTLTVVAYTASASVPSCGLPSQQVYSSSSSSNANLSKGAVAGIVIGVSIGLSLLCVLCVVCLMGGLGGAKRSFNSGSGNVGGGHKQLEAEQSYNTKDETSVEMN